MARKKATRTSKASELTLVKVAKTGGEVKEFALNGEKTVQAALSTAGIEHNSESRVRVNGQPAELDDTLKNGDIVTVSGNIKGGQA